MCLSQNTVTTELQKLLKTVDLATTTEKKVVELLRKQLGAGVDEHKKAIQQGVKDFLAEQSKILQASASGKRKADSSDQGSSKSQKTADGPSKLPIQLSNSRNADVSVFKGTVYVNIREFYEKDGKQLPGKKGISLSPEQFTILRDAADAISKALDAEDESYSIELSTKRRASISVFKSKPMVNIREYYEKDGQQLPGKKGISLAAEQWQALAEGLSALQEGLDEAHE
ncbi:hypothetical protein WJX74_001233 [Apatococcus lobatus]|uniref:DEK-C domain-containing protein n=1 Tax=Apatococcus lobatus TaxID=904363 RepID=A0AAW1QJ33_9CHLO